jgi:hypothetical protein
MPKWAWFVSGVLIGALLGVAGMFAWGFLNSY